MTAPRVGRAAPHMAIRQSTSDSIIRGGKLFEDAEEGDGSNVVQLMKERWEGPPSARRGFAAVAAAAAACVMLVRPDLGQANVAGFNQ